MDDNPLCYRDPTKNKYIFYEHTDKYMQYEKNCLQEKQYNQYESKCKSIGSAYDGQENIISTICLKFHCLINNIFNTKTPEYEENEPSHLEYLNYWLNHELHLNNVINCPEYFYQTMKSVGINNVILPKLRTNNNYIVKEEVDNMYVLYHLYKNYNEMNEIINNDIPNEQTFMKYANNCVEKYKELKAKCSDETTHLSNALNIFKTKYEQTKLNKAKLLEWKIDNLPSLDDTEDIQEKDTELSSINRYPVEKANEPSISLEKSELTPSTSAATLARPAIPMKQFSERVVVSAESGESNRSAQIQSLRSVDYTITLDEDRSTELKSEGDLSDYTRTIIGPAIGTIGMSSIFFIFYKFTSFGVWLFRGRRNNKNIRMNFDEQRNLFLDTSEYHYEYPSMESYNIAYNSA